MDPHIAHGLELLAIGVDLDGTITHVNRYAARVSNRTVDELVGSSWSVLFPDHADLLRERLQDAVNRRTTQRLPGPLSLAGDDRRRFEGVLCPATDDAGAVIAIQLLAWGSDQDPRPEPPDQDLWGTVTDGLDARSMSARRVQAILENAAMVISVYDRDMSIRYLNRVIQERDLAAIIGQTPLQWLTEPGRGVFREAFDRVVTTGEVAECEIQGASQRYWFVRLSPLLLEGRVAQVLGCALDVTERTRLQHQLARKEKLASLGIMARGVAHDFNNLLTSILGNVGLGRRWAASGGDLGLVFDEIESASHRAAGLCEEMMVYAGRVDPTHESGDLGLVIEELVPLTRAHSNPDVEVVREVASELPLVACSRVALGQIVLNLVNNAADAVSGGPGRVVISAEPVEVGDAGGDEYLPEPPAPGRYVRLQVADSGAGISLSEPHLIFDPFFTTKASGHGLGLPVVLGIVSSHRGAISVGPRLGGGTVMTVLLPITTAISDHSAAVEPALPECPGGKVMIVDDEDVVRRSVAAILREVGYQVIEADSGDTALSTLAVAGDSIQLMILDISMPGRDGYATLAELRKAHRDLPVLLSSGRQFTVPRDDRFVTGLPKPYTPDELLRSVSECIRRPPPP